MTTQLQSLRITGKIGNTVYQKTAPGHGNVPDDPTRTLQVRAYVGTNLSNTPAQASRRAKFAAAMATWQALTPDEKRTYRDRAARDGLSPMNAFISIYMRT